MKNLTFSSDKKIDTSLVKVGSKKIKKIQKIKELIKKLNDIDDKKKSL